MSCPNLREYKINFDCWLGSGSFGSVYGLATRPEKEKNFFSRYFPIHYDLICRSSPLKDTEYCIKIIDKPVIDSLFSYFFKTDPEDVFESFKIIRDAGIPANEVFPANYPFCYFKSRIRGKTLRDVLIEHRFLSKNEHFPLRLTLFEFSKKIHDADLIFDDLHCHNIMFDVTHNQWALIDVKAKKIKGKAKIHGRNCFIRPQSDLASYIIVMIFKLAKSCETYTLEMDNELIESYHERFTGKEVNDYIQLIQPYINSQKKLQKTTSCTFYATLFLPITVAMIALLIEFYILKYQQKS